ncbi:hypothetical protein [Roseinatronobacter ekhonensis]|nr:hypothetical protein [Roseibaca ekhonensis]
MGFEKRVAGHDMARRVVYARMEPPSTHSALRRATQQNGPNADA